MLKTPLIKDTNENSNNKRIVKNTFFLYFRMIIVMVVTLYTSRVILEVLGIDDYGIYQAVCGVVTFISFLNGALASGSSRFLTYELGKKENQKLGVVFSTTLTIHVVIAIIVFILGETIGLWFVKNKLIIPPERLSAAIFAFHFSMLTVLFTITQVPYDSLIIAHEHMNIYAYISLVQVALKLIIVVFLKFATFDKMKFYAVLLFGVTTLVMMIYRLYCRFVFPESKVRFVFNKEIFKSIAAFSGWSLFASLAVAASGQGVTILTNMFFAPAIVTARTLALQANSATIQFFTNFRRAVNPQIIKKYAAKDYEGSKKLLLVSTKYSYFLMWLIVLPLLLLTKTALKFWLGVIPDYTIIFLQIIIVQSLFQVFDTSFYVALYAKGRMKENALISPLIGFLQLPIVYVLFKNGFSPVVLSWVSLVCYAILGFVIKPILICKIVDYKFKEILNVYISCLKITVISCIIPLLINSFINKNSVLGALLILAICLLSVIATVYFLGIDKETKMKLKSKIVKRLGRKNK